MKNKMKKYLKDPKNAVILSVKGVNPKQLKKMADHYESVDLPGTETEPQQKASAKPVKGVRHQDTIKEAHRSDFVPAGSPAKEYLEGIEETEAYHKKGEKSPRRWMDLIRNLEGIFAAGAGAKARKNTKSRMKNMKGPRYRAADRLFGGKRPVGPRMRDADLKQRIIDQINKGSDAAIKKNIVAELNADADKGKKENIIKLLKEIDKGDE